MILYFSSSDLTADISHLRCRALRSRGMLVHIPSLAAPPDSLIALPFHIILLHFDQTPAGLPDIGLLRAAFPQAILISLAEIEAPGVWRILPGTDCELTAPTENDLAACIANIRQRYALRSNDIISPGLFLPEVRRDALLRGVPIALTPAEWVIVRALCFAAPTPLSSAVLAGFIRRSGFGVPLESIPSHIYQINRKANTITAARLISFSHEKGYQLCEPYCNLLPHEKAGNLS